MTVLREIRGTTMNTVMHILKRIAVCCIAAVFVVGAIGQSTYAAQEERVQTIEPERVVIAVAAALAVGLFIYVRRHRNA